MVDDGERSNSSGSERYRSRGSDSRSDRGSDRQDDKGGDKWVSNQPSRTIILRGLNQEIDEKIVSFVVVFQFVISCHVTVLYLPSNFPS